MAPEGKKCQHQKGTTPFSISKLQSDEMKSVVSPTNHTGDCSSSQESYEKSWPISALIAKETIVPQAETCRQHVWIPRFFSNGAESRNILQDNGSRVTSNATRIFDTISMREKSSRSTGEGNRYDKGEQKRGKWRATTSAPFFGKKTSSTIVARSENGSAACAMKNRRRSVTGMQAEVPKPGS
jgi:hypothetical protein